MLILFRTYCNWLVSSLNEWFHIAVVFSTERDGDSDEDKLSYPTHIDLYYNGDISTSLSTQRFLSYEDEEYIVGLSPVKKYALTGRFYHLMVDFSTYG